MKILSVVLALGSFVSSSALAAPMCVNNTLASYISLGAGGCDVGTATFSAFNSLTPITGATGIPLSAVNISPFLSGNLVGLDITVNVTASGNQLLEALFGYMITGGNITSSRVTLSGFNSSNGAFVTEIQNFCKGGNFLPNDVTGCANSDTLVVVDSGSDQKTFAAVNKLSIVDDLTFDAGGGGSATGGVLMDRFTFTPASSAVPEPSTYALMATTLAALLFRSRSKAGILTGKENQQ